ncbi:MAG: efflux RND transporter periplasmic adaptor subunit [Gemmatimonadaceae bacterium]
MNHRALFAALLAAATVAACRTKPYSGVEATGSLELTEVDVSPMVPARVTRVWHDEGDRVRAGDTLLTLTQATLPAEIGGKRAAVSQARAQLQNLEAGPRPAEVGQAEANVRNAEADAAKAAQDLERLTPLAASGTTSQQQLDAAKAAARATSARADAARDQLRLVREGARPEEIAAARAAVAAAQQSLAGAEATARDLVLTAPVAGSVLSRHVEPGEVLAPGASGMTIGNISRPYVRIYVDEFALPSIHVGDTALVYLDALPNRPFRGTVVSLSDRAEFTPRVALTSDERADLMFGVKVQLGDSTATLKAGLPVTVRIPAGRAK